MWRHSDLLLARSGISQSAAEKRGGGGGGGAVTRMYWRHFERDYEIIKRMCAGDGKCVEGWLPLVLNGGVYGVKRALLNALVLHLNLWDRWRGEEEGEKREDDWVEEEEEEEEVKGGVLLIMEL